MNNNKYLCMLLTTFLLIIFMDIYYLNYNSPYNKEKCISAFPNNNDDSCLVQKEEIIEQPEAIVKTNYLENQVGYIRIEGTDIDGNIMQYTDNDFYLNHDNNGNYYVYGSIYMDYRNSFDDQKILIFGHNTNGNSISPLHDLENYDRFSFYQEHPYIMIELNGQTHKWHVFSVLVVSNKSNKHMKLEFTDEEWQQHLNWLKSNSLYNTNVNVNLSNQIVTIQTCYYGEAESFILVSAKKEK